jgi:predicted RNA binding protein YcfA (HicA-like mRNA interferase family)
MPHIAPLHHKKLVRVFELSGFVLDRIEGDHLVYQLGSQLGSPTSKLGTVLE